MIFGFYHWYFKQFIFSIPITIIGLLLSCYLLYSPLVLCFFAFFHVFIRIFRFHLIALFQSVSSCCVRVAKRTFPFRGTRLPMVGPLPVHSTLFRCLSLLCRLCSHIPTFTDTTIDTYYCSLRKFSRFKSKDNLLFPVLLVPFQRSELCWMVFFTRPQKKVFLVAFVDTAVSA